jgi:hypothetical protein
VNIAFALAVATKTCRRAQWLSMFTSPQMLLANPYMVPTRSSTILCMFGCDCCELWLLVSTSRPQLKATTHALTHWHSVQDFSAPSWVASYAFHWRWESSLYHMRRGVHRASWDNCMQSLSPGQNCSVEPSCDHSYLGLSGLGIRLIETIWTPS